MAEITTNNQHKNGKRLLRKSTRVDLTPMVDLGFLLITFFVFTTTMSTTTAMGMVTPKDKNTIKDKICESCVITVLLAANNKLYYYEGTESNAPFKVSDYSAKGLRTLLMNKRKQVLGINREPILIIKPSTTSTFKNLINSIDESNICMYKRYYIDQLSATEKIKLISQFYTK